MSNELVICPNCNYRIEDGVEICPNCGAHFDIHMNNVSNDIDTRSFSNNSNSVFIINQNPDKKKEKKKSKSFIRGLVIGVVLGLFVGSICTGLICNYLLNKKNTNKEVALVKNLGADIGGENKLDNSASDGETGNEQISGQMSNDTDGEKTTSISENNVISSKNLYPIFYNENNIEISMDNCQYTENASDIRIVLDVNNNSQQIIEVGFSNIQVDDAQINMYLGNSESYKVGNVASNFYIALEDIEAAGVTNFTNINCVIYGKDKDGNELFSKDITINRDAFVPYQ